MGPPTFDLRLVVAFAVLGDELHFGRAATRLSITQPALSRQIARLEDQLGLQLLVRSSRRVELTPAGARFHAGSWEIVTRAADAEAELRPDDVALSLHLGDASSPLVREAVAMFCTAHPGIAALIADGTATSATAAVLDGSADVGFGLPHEVHHDLAYATLDRPRLGVACAADHPLAASPEAEWDDLQGETLFFAAPGIADGYNTLVRSLLHERGVTCIEKIVQVPKGEYVGAYIADGRGVLVCAPYLFDPAPQGVSWIGLRPTIHGELGVMWRPDRTTAAAATFIRWVKALAVDHGGLGARDPLDGPRRP